MVSQSWYVIIFPFILYGITVLLCYNLPIHTIWYHSLGASCNTYLTPIHIMQEKFVRLVTNKDKYHSVPGLLAHTPPNFHELKILTIFDIYKLQVGKLFHEILHIIGPS